MVSWWLGAALALCSPIDARADASTPAAADHGLVLSGRVRYVGTIGGWPLELCGYHAQRGRLAAWATLVLEGREMLRWCSPEPPCLLWQTALTTPNSYGGYGAAPVDWCRGRVFAVYGTRRTFVDCRYYGGADWDYLVGDGLGVTSLDMSSGQELWTRPFADGVVAMCAASAGCVFVVSGEGLHVLDPASGAPRLIVPTRSSQACLVQLPHAPWHVLFANEQGLWRADARSAEAVWYSPAPYGQRLDIGLAGVVVGRRTAAVMTRGGVLRAVDLSSGATVWEHPPALVSALHGTRDVLLVDSRDLSRVDAYSGASGEPMWHLAADSIGRDGVRTCAVAKGSALVFSSETKRRRVACVRLADGAVLARRPASDGWNPSCATTENSFWYRQDGSTAVGLSKTTGREVGRICLTARGRTDASAPCIGQVIGLGDLVVAEVKEGLVVVGETE